MKTYQFLIHLAEEGRVAVVIDGLDELGTMSMKDVQNAARTASHPTQSIDIKTICVGIIEKKFILQIIREDIV